MRIDVCVFGGGDEGLSGGGGGLFITSKHEGCFGPLHSHRQHLCGWCVCVN